MSKEKKTTKTARYNVYIFFNNLKKIEDKNIHTNSLLVKKEMTVDEKNKNTKII